jgi:hypothetical protein
MGYTTEGHYINYSIRSVNSQNKWVFFDDNKLTVVGNFSETITHIKEIQKKAPVGFLFQMVPDKSISSGQSR